MKKQLMMILLAIPILYGLTGLYVCYNIDHLAFVPNRMDFDEPYKFHFPFAEELIELDEEVEVSILYSKTQLASKGLILFFHGNSGDLRTWGGMSPQFHMNGYDVVMIDYPGFGKSKGKHSEQALYDCADKLFTWASKEYDAEDMVIVGRSIGTVPASYLSSQQKVKSVILETPLGNMGSLIKNKFSYAPICKKMYNRFAVDQWIKDSKNEVHIIRAENDRLIEGVSNEHLLAFSASHFMVKGAEHGDIGNFETYQKRISELLLN